MKIVELHEFIGMYRGDKDLRVGKILSQKYGCEYVVIAPSVASPADNKIFGTNKFPQEKVGKLPPKMRIVVIPAKLVFHRRSNISLGGFFQVSPTLFFEIRKQRPDLIFENPFTTLTPRSFFTYLASKIFKIPIVYFDVGDIVPLRLKHKILSIMERPIIKNAKAIITYNQAGKKRFLTKYKTKQEKVIVIPKPVDTVAFNPDVSAKEFRIKWDLVGKFVVGYFGRLDRNKGCEYLIHAAKKLQEWSKKENVVFLFVGGNIVDKDARYVETLFRKVESENIRRTGMIPHKDTKYAYAATDLVVFPDVTNLPGFSTVLAESMASGKPIIIGIKGFEDAVPLKHKETALIIKPRSVDEIVDSILLLKKNQALREKLSCNVRKFAEQEMDYEKVVAKYYEIFKKVIGAEKLF